MRRAISLPKKENNEKPVLTVAAYCRVSTVSSELLGSLDLQKREYAEQIERNPSWISVGVFTDIGSGRNLSRRSGLIQLIELCRFGRVDLILTKSISRLGRNTVDTLRTLGELRSLNVDVWFEIENIHLLEEDRRLVLDVLSAVAQGESESKSENIKWGLRHAFKNPDSKSSHFICYGYEHDETGHLVIKEDEAAVVRLIFQMRSEGVSLRSAALCICFRQAMRANRCKLSTLHIRQLG